MTLDEAIADFKKFLDNLLDKCEPIGKPYLSNEYLQAFAKIGDSWDRQIIAEKERINKELSETEFELFLKSIAETHKLYNDMLKSRVSKITPTYIKD